jgi:hypothetical protein
VLRADLHVGVDGVARVIPPMDWTSGLRREQHTLTQSLPGMPPAVLHLCAFLWESLAGLGLAACREGDRWPEISTLGVQVSPELDALLSGILNGRAHFESAATLAAVIERDARSVATREGVRNWLLSLIKTRLVGRANVLRSHIPAQPSGEIPLVQVPTDLDAVRFGVAMRQPSEEEDTVPSMPFETIPTPRPFAHEGEDTLETSALSLEEAGVKISSVPPSSVRSSSGSPDVTRRAPLEDALAEYAERASSPGRRPSK